MCENKKKPWASSLHSGSKKNRNNELAGWLDSWPNRNSPRPRARRRFVPERLFLQRRRRRSSPPPGLRLNRRRWRVCTVCSSACPSCFSRYPSSSTAGVRPPRCGFSWRPRASGLEFRGFSSGSPWTTARDSLYGKQRVLKYYNNIWLLWTDTRKNVYVIINMIWRKCGLVPVRSSKFVHLTIPVQCLSKFRVVDLNVYSTFKFAYSWV